MVVISKNSPRNKSPASGALLNVISPPEMLKSVISYCTTPPIDMSKSRGVGIDRGAPLTDNEKVVCTPSNDAAMLSKWAMWPPLNFIGNTKKRPSPKGEGFIVTVRWLSESALPRHLLRRQNN